MRDFNRQRRLARPGGSGEREQPIPTSDQNRHFGEFDLTSNETV